MPIEFKEVALCRVTGWTYWELVSQPVWFLEKLLLYIQAEGITANINKQRSKHDGIRR